MNERDNTSLREALPDEFSLADEHLSKRLGRAFADREGVRFGNQGLYLVRSGSHGGTSFWSVRASSDDPDTGERARLVE